MVDRVGLNKYGLFLLIFMLVSFVSSSAWSGNNTWTATSALPPVGVFHIQVSRDNPDVIYGGMGYEGTVIKSTTRGLNWSIYSVGLGGSSEMKGIIISDPSGDTAMAGFYSGGVSPLFWTTDGGLTWTTRTVGFNDDCVSGMSLHPTNPSIIYCGTEMGLWRTEDLGNSWEFINNGIPTTQHSYSVAVDPVNQSILYAGSQTGIYKSYDNASSWSLLTTQTGTVLMQKVLMDPFNHHTFYAMAPTVGIYKSTDEGTTISLIAPLSVFSGSLKALVVNPVKPGFLYVSSYPGGVFVSHDGGNSWTSINTGLPNTSTGPLTIDSIQGDTLYVGLTNPPYGVYTYTENLTDIPDTLWQGYQ